jgi:hypothetical protein
MEPSKVTVYPTKGQFSTREATALGAAFCLGSFLLRREAGDEYTTRKRLIHCED